MKKIMLIKKAIVNIAVDMEKEYSITKKIRIMTQVMQIQDLI